MEELSIHEETVVQQAQVDYKHSMIYLPEREVLYTRVHLLTKSGNWKVDGLFWTYGSHIIKEFFFIAIIILLEIMDRSKILFQELFE